MLYKVMHTLIGAWMRIHLRRLFIRGLENVPSKGPIILTCNHGNAFLDAVIVAITLERPVHFLTRADVFKKPLQRYILGKLKMIPVYRIRDGIDSLEQNTETFALCSKILKQGGAILIFSEGNAHPEKRLRPLKKGSARIAIQAAEAMEWTRDLKIVPVGINYTNHTQFRTEILLGFGLPITVADFRPEIESDLARGTRAINHQIFQGIEAEMVHVPEKNMDEVADIALAIGRAEKQYPIFRFHYVNEGRLDHEQHVLSNFIERDSPEIREKLFRFAKKSQDIHMPLSLAHAQIPDGRMAFLILGFVPALLGLIIHALPMSLAFWFTGKKVRDPQFINSVLMGTGFFFTAIWYIIIAVCLVFLEPYLLLLIPIFPILLRIAFLYSEALGQQRARALRKSME